MERLKREYKELKQSKKWQVIKYIVVFTTGIILGILIEFYMLYTRLHLYRYGK